MVPFMFKPYANLPETKEKCAILVVVEVEGDVEVGEYVAVYSIGGLVG